MTRGAGGDNDAFGLLVGRWENRVFSFLHYMLGSREEAQDVTQEAFIRMCRSAESYRPSGQFRSWLFRIAGNLARSRLRRRKILRFVHLDPVAHELPDQVAGPDRPLEQEEELVAVRRAVVKLPARQRQAIVLKQYQGLAYKEIATAMQTTVSAVETLLYRAMTSLRKELRGQGDRR